MTKNADKKVAPVVVSDTVSAASETAQPTSEQAAAQTEAAAGHDVATTASGDTSSPENVEADVHPDEGHQAEDAAQNGEKLPPILSDKTDEVVDTTKIEDPVEEVSTAPLSDRPQIDTVRMIRDEPMHDGGPVEADVHPDEVQNWFAVGWRVE